MSQVLNRGNRRFNSRNRSCLLFFLFYLTALLSCSETSLNLPLGGGIRTIDIFPESLRTECIERLDRLDKQFDERRLVRQIALPKKNVPEKNVFDPFEPEASCFTEERFGSGSNIRFDAFGDGPKFVCGVDYIAKKQRSRNIFESLPCLVYSIGSNNDIQFEKSIHHFLGCEIHTFDPTVDDFVGHEHAIFHPWGIGKDGEEDSWESKKWTSKSFPAIFRQLGHMNRTIDIVKIDCEGCEYEAMPLLFHMIASRQIDVNQILIEMHRTNFTHVSNFFRDADNAGMRVFHKERNGWGCLGFRCVEYSLISESFLRDVNREQIC